MTRRYTVLVVILILVGATLIPTSVSAGGTLSVDLQFRGGKLDTSHIYLNLVYGSAREYFGAAPYQSCAGYYSRPTELVAALYLSSVTGQPPRTILKNKKGRGWGRLAKDMGLPSNYWAKGHGRGKKARVEYVDDARFESELYLRYLSSYYGADRRQMEFWLQRGLDETDLLIGLNLAARTGRPAATIMSLRTNGLSWAVIAVRFGQNPAVLTRPAPPRTRAARR